MSTMYSKKRDLPVYKEKSNTSEVVAKLGFSEEVETLEQTGRWFKIETAQGKKGWVYGGNLAPDEPPADNKNDFMPTKADDVSVATAGRALDGFNIMRRPLILIIV